ncbi:hypothetical protein [Microbacterium sp. Leaf151]|uniref:hypothetical protein n=1 Tax=Microbacterium sp. Leaf151 TaxID=1736276 RepID=UPI000700BFAB|nr:hypothetical protein [Microbacterium sp. Leaf151]KQR21309.1 hypothetical protein ASF76_13705 [Microbacterium sp. Leaf151]
MSGTLTRDDIIDGIRDLILHLREAGSTATIQIVGGAAIALTIDGDRAATVDIDGPITPPEAVAVAAAEVARNKGWPPDWVNDKAKIFLPDGMGRSAEWVTLHDQDGILIQAASPAMLLAMKLRAFERRGLRDADDVAVLLAVLEIQTADEAEDLLNEFFPAEDLSPRTFERVRRLLESGAPNPPLRPELPDFS